MVKDRQQTKITNQLIYDQGRNARLQGASVNDCPYPPSVKVGNSKAASDVGSRRIDWHTGWYDQHYGTLHEPKDADIKNRVWPIHL